MKNFENLLQEIRNIAKSVTKEELNQYIKEYEEIYDKRNYNVFLTTEKEQNYILENQYFFVDTFDVFTNTYPKIA